MKTNFFKVLLAITAAVFVAACTSSGNTKLASMDHSTASHLFVSGKTTKKDVELALGEPGDVDFDSNGNEKWIYWHSKTRAKGANFIPIANIFSSGSNHTRKKLVIMFDKKGILQKQAFSKSDAETQHSWGGNWDH